MDTLQLQQTKLDPIQSVLPPVYTQNHKMPHNGINDPMKYEESELDKKNKIIYLVGGIIMFLVIFVTVLLGYYWYLFGLR